MCVLIFSTTLVWNISHSREFSHMLYPMYIGLHVKYPSFLLDINKIWNFSTGFQKILKYEISWKTVQC
jgi:hypothetical protein